MFRHLFLIALLVLPAAVRADLPDFESIVQESAPAVVKILVQSERQAFPGAEEMEQIPEYLRRFFEFRGGPPQRQQRNMGSGFIVSADGYIVTNHHVVEGASEVTVRLLDRREYDAEVVGTDVRSDLALLKIDADDLEVLEIADGDVNVGEWVLAIGSPFGLDFSVTAGIVSAKGRSLPTEAGENYVPFIQTDVAINPGNSGGPLFNLDGEVVGVNSQIFTRSGGSIGLSFAIPAVVVRNVVMQLRDRGEVTRGWLGVSIQDVDRNLAESFGMDRPMGALVAQVGADSPAEQAGIESGDIILEFDGQAINSSSDLPHVVGLIAPGTSATAVIRRDGKTVEIDVEVGGLDADERAMVSGLSGQPDSERSILGLVLEDADPEMMTQMGLSGGVLVLEVVADSAASQAGIQGGDVITRLGSTAVQSMADFERAAERLQPGQSVAVRLVRGGAPLFLAIRVPQPEQ
ncbi:MAG: DegQ family serine endoprotease [Cellvibrionales bacterium]|jgi:serine protease Do